MQLYKIINSGKKKKEKMQEHNRGKNKNSSEKNLQ